MCGRARPITGSSTVLVSLLPFLGVSIRVVPWVAEQLEAILVEWLPWVDKGTKGGWV